MTYKEALARIVYDATGLSVDEINQTPLCELRNRLPEKDRAYGGLHPAHRDVHPTTRTINLLLDEALERVR